MPGIGDDFQSAVGQLIEEEFVVPDGGELILSPFFMPSTPGLLLTAAGQSGGRFQRTQTCEGPLLVGELSGPAAFKLVGDHAFIAHHPGIMP